MSRKLLVLSVSAALLGGTAYADAPRVAADIAPVHSLVARVMEGVGTPDLIIPPGESPHGFSMRPSSAQALQEADLVFWVGHDLTPQLEDAIETLAEDAGVTELLDADGTMLLDFREGALFDAHEHGDEDDHDHEGRSDEGHDEGHEDAKAEGHDHDDHGDEEHAEHDDHDDEEHAEHDDHEGHDHGDHDPHAWLSPDNARVWLNAIAAQLSATDPDNAGAYFANAAAARDEIDALSAEITATLEPVHGGRFMVFHDAYQYFETAFDIQATGAISIGDASDPSPARISEIQGRITEQGVDCILAEPQFNPSLVETVLDGTQAKTSVIDPLGSDLDPGADLYPQMMRNMAQALAGCFSGG